MTPTPDLTAEQANPPAPAKPRSEPHWIVTTHYRMRTLSFLNAFLFCAMQIRHEPAAPWLWALLAGQFLVYPHVVYLRARRAADSQRAELQNLLLDCFLIAIPAALIGFPLWITFTLFIAVVINNAITRGMRGIVYGSAAFAAGAGLGGLATGFRIAADSDPWVTALCLFGVVWYLLGIGQVAYKRAQLLRSTRERLKRGELSLQRANESLQAQLAEIKVLQEQLREQANRDPLTGLYNRRYLQATIGRELARCRREQAPLCVLLVDIDHFKRVNDRFGHAAGDEVIRLAARLLAAEARSDDVVCRYGGEEFLLLMPKLPLATAVARAERWRAAFAAASVTAGAAQISATLSIGIAMFPEHGDDGETLINHADRALYAAKSAGRNRVAVHAGNADGFTGAA